MNYASSTTFKYVFPHIQSHSPIPLSVAFSLSLCLLTPYFVYSLCLSPPHTHTHTHTHTHKCMICLSIKGNKRSNLKHAWNWTAVLNYIGFKTVDIACNCREFSKGSAHLGWRKVARLKSYTVYLLQDYCGLYINHMVDYIMKVNFWCLFTEILHYVVSTFLSM